MRETWNAARVGLMVVLGLIVTFVVYRYVDERSSTQSGHGVYAYFDDVQGLIAKSRGLVAGISAGYISSICLEGRSGLRVIPDGGEILATDQGVPTRTNRLKFSAQFGKSISFATPLGAVAL